jgi:N-carbamoyl-L-amino-acid hydrolase
MSTEVHEGVGRIAARIDEARLWARHMALAAFGRTPRGGVNRQALSAEEIAARAALLDWGRAIGLEPSTDAIGNLFLRLPGRDPRAAPVVTGSHIDSQPTGGRFDGAFGVLAGLEALEAMVEEGVRPRRSIDLVAWTNEEGSRFAPGMMGSEAFAGVRPLEQILAVADADGVTVAEALRQVRAAAPELPERPLGFPVAAYVEAHIEQGPELEAQGVPVGVVTGIQGTRRFRVDVVGEAAHAGTAPRRVRKDALSAAVAMVRSLEATMWDEADVVRFTVGLFRVEPNAPSVVPARVHFSVDLRHPDGGVLADLGDRIQPLCESSKGPCAVRVREIARAEPLTFPPEIRSRIRSAAAALGIAHRDLCSAAGHDARQLHGVCPAGMIFVPCKDGLSHNEAESAEPGHLGAGARVLAEVLLGLADDREAAAWNRNKERKEAS